jgi:hypothetical protein
VYLAVCPQDEEREYAYMYRVLGCGKTYICLKEHIAYHEAIETIICVYRDCELHFNILRILSNMQSHLHTLPGDKSMRDV